MGWKAHMQSPCGLLRLVLARPDLRCCSQPHPCCGGPLKDQVLEAMTAATCRSYAHSQGLQPKQRDTTGTS